MDRPIVVFFIVCTLSLNSGKLDFFFYLPKVCYISLLYQAVFE